MRDARWLGPALVGLAAFFWATDSVFRAPTVNALDPTFIVFVEHALGVLLLAPWVLARRARDLASLRGHEWVSVVLIGVGGSAVATVLFTEAFRHANPSVVILLQKLQPVLVVLLAYAFLGEKPGRGFYLWGSVALAAAIVLGFPDLSFDLRGASARGILYDLASVLLWAISTVAGKHLLRRHAPSVTTFWRFLLGLAALAAILAVMRPGIDWDRLREPEILRSLAYMSLIPGLLAMITYYAGMERTPANVTTFVELIFPIGAVILNAVFLDARLELFQLVAGAVLLVAVTLISYRRGAGTGPAATSSGTL
jgi:drug/metabolite transporter (DMT)-like permease